MGALEGFITTSASSAIIGGAIGFVIGYGVDCYVYYAQEHALMAFKEAMSDDQSVLIVTWEIKGGPKPGHKWTGVYSWNEKELPF